MNLIIIPLGFLECIYVYWGKGKEKKRALEEKIAIIK